MRSRDHAREPDRADFVTSTIVEWLPVFTSTACCDLVVRSDSASRYHARIEYNRGKFMLVDESSNGTYVEVEEARGARRNLVYVRNEMFALVGSGRFSLGTRPTDDPHVLAFRSA